MSEVVEIDEPGNVVYVRDESRPSGYLLAPISVLEGIDWLALAKQKNALVNSICDDPDSLLWGLIDFIDDIQDAAEKRGYRVVYGYNLQEWRNDNPAEEN